MTFCAVLIIAHRGRGSRDFTNILFEHASDPRLRLGQGVPEGDVYSISAATGEGVLDLVRGARARLDAMPAEPLTLQVSTARAQLEPQLETRETPCQYRLSNGGTPGHTRHQ